MLLCTKCCIKLKLGEDMMSCGGLLPKEDCSRSSPSIAMWLLLQLATYVLTVVCLMMGVFLLCFFRERYERNLIFARSIWYLTVY